MRLLLDTHAFLWWAANDTSLTKRARSAISDASNECFLSVASVWEMAIKLSLGKLRLPEPIDQFIPGQLQANGFVQLPIEFRHVSRVAALQLHHRDPFDRLLIAQAEEQDLTIVSVDRSFKSYGVQLLW